MLGDAYGAAVVEALSWKELQDNDGGKEKHEEAKQGKAGSLFFQLFSLPGGRGGNVKINVDRIAAKSGRNGGNFAAELNHHHLAVFLAAIRCRLPPTQLFFAFLCFAELLVLQRAGLSQFISLTLLQRQCVGRTTTSNQAQNL